MVPEEQQRMQQQMETRASKKKPVYYFTRLNDNRDLIVYAFPILQAGEYRGAIAIVIPINEIELSSLEDHILPE